MKNFRSLILVAAVVCAFSAVSASAQVKIASVDMRKLFEGFYKTKLAESALDKDKVQAKKDIKDMADGLTKAESDYKQLLDQANDQAISTDAREKLRASADQKANEISNGRVAFQKFERQAEARLADQSQRMSGSLIDEIQKAVSEKAKLGGYTLVVNSGSPETVVYVSPDNDITASVLAQLNAGAPSIDTTPTAGSGGLQLNMGADTNSTSVQ